MYLSIANHLGLHISEPLYTNLWVPPPATLDLPVSIYMIALRGAQAVGLGSHLSHLIYIYKLKITKYMYMTPYTHGPLSVVLGLGYVITYGVIANA